MKATTGKARPQLDIRRIAERHGMTVAELMRTGAEQVALENGDGRPQLQSPADIAQLVADLQAEEQECLTVLSLNTRNRLIARTDLYRGSLDTSVVRIGELFREAIRRNARAIILCHNHPSGDPSPSPEDVVITRAAIQAGELLDIDVLDHVVIGAGQWVSMRAMGAAFT